MLNWIKGLFKKDWCDCRGCGISRSGCGYSPCRHVGISDNSNPPQPLSTRNFSNIPPPPPPPPNRVIKGDKLIPTRPTYPPSPPIKP